MRSIGYWVLAWAPMHQHLNFRKICSRWVSNHLTAGQRNTRTALSLSHLQRYHEEEYGFLLQIVIGDETWGQHFEPESKQWKQATSPSPKKSKAVHTSSGKVMMSFFFTTMAYFLSSFWNREPPSQCPALSSHITEP
ncbi:uncharacterized protein TNCV_3951351 [Trichonephila clavipes]|nr:uncharacterized protein TNCV_3951351 [Trichonephila clavipes]